MPVRANEDCLKSLICKRKKNPTPNNCKNVMTWAATCASEKKDDIIKQKFKTAIISKK